MADKKQAVVIIHGMGEQTPLETLRSFVKSVWETDPTLRSNNPAEDGVDASASQNDWWIKPDNRPGLVELRRFTTGPLTGDQNEMNWPLDDNHGRRTDFFEFYWADLVKGTRSRHVFSWVSNLLFRRFDQVPYDAALIWVCLWIFCIAFLGYGFFSFNALLPDHLKLIPQSIGGILSAPFDRYFLNFIEVVSHVINRETLGLVIWVFGIALAFMMTLIAILSKIRPKLQDNGGLAIGLLAAGVLLFVFWPGIAHLVTSRVFWWIVFIVAIIKANRLLNTYFGDIARYVQATPENIGLRRDIVERGLALLKSLHESDEYDRVVVVAHSQGTLVAYDLLNSLWSEYGPHFDNASRLAAEQPLEDMDAYLRSALEGKVDFQLGVYRKMQRAISARLKDAPFVSEGPKNWSRPWLISDFITLGSPLSHAEFLIARDKARLDQLIRERLLPACPPILNAKQVAPGGKATEVAQASFLYGADNTDHQLAHHGSVFAAVRWTNICDPSPPLKFWLGDPLSGTVTENFGSSIRVVGRDEQVKELLQNTKANDPDEHDSGILDLKIQIQSGHSGVLKRMFTHNQYWAWSDDFDINNPPEHIRALRDAINLAEPEQ